jgi:hypothetical protein
MVELAHLLAIDDIEAGQLANQICSMKRLRATRRGSHIGSVSSLMDLFNHVCVVLQNFASDSTAGTHHADGDTAFNYMITFEFVFILCMMREILEIRPSFTKEIMGHSK